MPLVAGRYTRSGVTNVEFHQQREGDQIHSLGSPANQQLTSPPPFMVCHCGHRVHLEHTLRDRQSWRGEVYDSYGEWLATLCITCCTAFHEVDILHGKSLSGSFRSSEIGPAMSSSRSSRSETDPQMVVDAFLDSEIRKIRWTAINAGQLAVRCKFKLGEKLLQDKAPIADVNGEEYVNLL